MIRLSLLSTAACCFAACSSQTVSDAPKKITDKVTPQSASAASGFDKTIAVAERKLDVAMRSPLTIPVSYTHLTLPTILLV